MSKPNKNETFDHKIQKLFEADAKEVAICQICKGKHPKDNRVKKTKSFQDVGSKERFKKIILDQPLNNDHKGTYSHNFEFMLNDDMWKKTMKNSKAYICLECWEREYLTPYLMDNPVEGRESNKFDKYQIEKTDFDWSGNVVNNDVKVFLDAVEKQKNQNQKDVDMIGSQNMKDFSADDEVGFSDYYDEY